MVSASCWRWAAARLRLTSVPAARRHSGLLLLRGLPLGRSPGGSAADSSGKYKPQGGRNPLASNYPGAAAIDGTAAAVGCCVFRLMSVPASRHQSGLLLPRRTAPGYAIRLSQLPTPLENTNHRVAAILSGLLAIRGPSFSFSACTLKAHLLSESCLLVFCWGRLSRCHRESPRLHRGSPTAWRLCPRLCMHPCCALVH